MFKTINGIPTFTFTSKEGDNWKVTVEGHKILVKAQPSSCYVSVYCTVAEEGLDFHANMEGVRYSEFTLPWPVMEAILEARNIGSAALDE